MLPEMRILIRALVIAGLVAGLLTAVFHLVVSEPFVDRAITLEARAQEKELQATGGAEERHEDVFSRRTQKGGLVVGLLAYGVAVAATFAGVYTLMASRLPGRGPREQVAGLVGVALIAVVLVPFVKYPANPPGVGEPGTLARRQLLYISCVLFSLAGAWLALRLVPRLRSRVSNTAAAGGGVLFFLVWSALILVLLPNRSDPISMPTRLLWQFRIASLAGQVLFWAVFGVLFATLLHRRKQELSPMVVPP